MASQTATPSTSPQTEISATTITSASGSANASASASASTSASTSGSNTGASNNKPKTVKKASVLIKPHGSHNSPVKIIPSKTSANQDQEKADSKDEKDSTEKKRTICTWENKLGTQIIACIQILCSIALLFKSVTITIEELEDGDEFMHEAEGIMNETSTEHIDPLPYAYVATNRKIQLVLGCIGLTLGCFLLTGTHMRLPVLLLCWMIVSWMLLIVNLLILMSLLFLLATGNGLATIVVFLVFAVPFGVQYLFYRTVSSHRRELIEQLNRKHPAVLFQAVSVEADGEK